MTEAVGADRTEATAAAAAAEENDHSSKRTRKDDTRVHYNEIKRENALFTDYYKKQGIVPEAEWDGLMSALQTVLPLTFRLTGHREEAESISRQLKETLLPKLGNMAHPLAWYRPAGYGWHLDTDRKTMRTEENNAEFHKWLVAATENGDISRQEAVSMIPPLFLDVHADHLVLDMCAAPGSKTAQLVEYMHADGIKRAVLPTGLVIANDADQQRAYMLYHQVKRILSPCLLVTNNDGTTFPTLTQRTIRADDEASVERVLFDRVLADVPCSGDGTLRKNATLWRTWTPHQALGLHPLQIRLLEKALRLLKVGGRTVYSTCSMNVVENEAVVAHVLNKYSHAVELVDVSAELPELVRRPGHTSWKVLNKEGVEYKTPEEVPDKRRFPPSLFPKKSYASLHLERCLRIYPHLQNTGGFFVAVISKKADMSLVEAAASVKPGELIPALGDEASSLVQEEAPSKIAKPSQSSQSSQLSPPSSVPLASGAERRGGAPKKTRAPLVKIEGEFRHLDPNNEAVLDTIFDWYGIDKARIVEEGFGFMVRSERDPIRIICIVSSRAKPIFSATVRPHRSPAEDDNIELYNRSLKIVNAGVRAFELYESNRPVPVPCPYRPLAESIGVLRPYMAKRVAMVPKEVLVQLLSSPDSIELDVARQLGQGGAVLESRTTKDDHLVTIPVWISERGVKAFVPNANRPALLLQLV